MNTSRLNICQKQEQFVLERSARLNLDPGRCDRGDGGDLDDREGGGQEIPEDGRRSGKPTKGSTRGPRGPKKQKQSIQTILSRQLDTFWKVLKSYGILRTLPNLVQKIGDHL